MSSRADLLAKTHKVLKKHYKPVTGPERSLLEHLLFAACYANSHSVPAEDAFARLQEAYFDWNEVRVTTVSELAEVLDQLADPAAAASRLKKTLQSVFEAHYSFDLEFLKKLPLGKAVKELENLQGLSRFAIAYATQHALGGHAIPVNRGAFDALHVLGAITADDVANEQVPGLERAIPKNKGGEFASLLHQLGVDYFNSPFSPKIRGTLVEITPDTKERLPKRSGSSKTKDAAGEATGGADSESAEGGAAQQATTSPAAGSGSKPGKGSGSKASDSPDSDPKLAAGKPAKAKKTPRKKAAGKSSAEPDTAAGKKKSTTKRLAKKKPR